MRRYVTVGAGTGLAAGVIEATLVHRAGLVYIPFAALAYGVLFGAGFLVLALLASLLRRDLLALGLGLAATLFAGLEIGFWLNVSANPLEEAASGRNWNLAILAGSLALGVAVFLLARGRSARLGSWRPVLPILAATLAVLAAYFGISSRASQPGPNCILISIDALRADHLGAYGYSRATSPNIDALARRGVLWERAYTQSPGTTGGHGCMLTGLYTLSNGAYLNGFPLDSKVETLAEVFAANGWATAAFIDNWYLSPALGFGQGFDCFVDGGKAMVLKDACPMIFFRGLLLYQVIHRSLAPPGAPSELEVVDAMRWMAWRKHHRFFLFIHVLDPHSPYVPPGDLMGRFGGGGQALDPAYIEGLHAKSLETTLTIEEQGILIDRYDEEVMSADRKVGVVLAELERLGLLDRSLVIVTADHGEVMAESSQKEFGHGTLDYGCLHVPLVMYLGGQASRRQVPAGTRVPDVSGTVDILPTIVDLLELKDSAHRQGESLATGVLRGGEGSGAAAAPTLASMPETVAAPKTAPASRTAFTTGDIEARDEYSAITNRWQYVIQGDRISLYDLNSNGPDPAPSVIAKYPAVADTLQTSVEAWIARCLAEAVVPYSIKGRSVAPGKEALQRLKALGYIQ